MTFTPRLLTTTAAFALVFATTAPVAAMTCGEFMEMDESQQMEAVAASGGREEARDDANSADAGGSGGDDASVVVDKDESTGGQEAQREDGRGADVIVRVLEECSKDSAAMLDDVISRTQ